MSTKLPIDELQEFLDQVRTTRAARICKPRHNEIVVDVSIGRKRARIEYSSVGNGGDPALWGERTVTLDRVIEEGLADVFVFKSERFEPMPGEIFESRRGYGTSEGLFDFVPKPCEHKLKSFPMFPGHGESFI